MAAGSRSLAAAASRTGQHLAAFRSRYPDGVARYDSFRRGKGSAELGTWPDWCHVPMAGSVAIVSDGVPYGTPLPDSQDIPRVAALAPWRMGRGIYRVDPDVYRALAETDLPEDVPVAPLYRLPEWCVYLDLPGEEHAAGCYAHLEFDVNTGRPELRLLIDTGAGWNGLLAIMMFLDETSLSDIRQGPLPPEYGQYAQRLLHGIADRILNTLLYLVAKNADIHAPSCPDERPARVDGRGQGPKEPRVWEVGYRIGARLRSSGSSGEGPSGTGERSGPRPHIRRAHWHHYWVGPRDAEDRESVLRWILPTLVASKDPEDLVADIHRLD